MFAVAEEFNKKRLAKCQGRLNKSIIFLDEIKFNFSFCKSCKYRNEKIVTLYFALAKDGTMIKPLLNYCLNIEISPGVDELQDAESYHSEFEEQALSQWIEKCLLPHTKGRACFLFFDQHNGHSSPIILKDLALHGVEALIFPAGTGCILNPLRGVLPVLQNAVMSLARESDYAISSRVRLKQSMVHQWITQALVNIQHDDPDLYVHSMALLNA